MQFNFFHIALYKKMLTSYFCLTFNFFFFKARDKWLKSKFPFLERFLEIFSLFHIILFIFIEILIPSNKKSRLFLPIFVELFVNSSNWQLYFSRQCPVCITLMSSLIGSCAWRQTRWKLKSGSTEGTGGSTEGKYRGWIRRVEETN